MTKRRDPRNPRIASFKCSTGNGTAGRGKYGAFRVKKNGSLSKFMVKKERQRERERKGDKGTGIRNVDGRGIGRWNERKRGKGRAVQLHLMSFERWIAKECVDSRINSRPFSSFLFHRRCSSTYATRSKLEFLPSVSVFRHIRNEINGAADYRNCA